MSSPSPCTPAPRRDADLAYGSLATYVTDHALAVEGPIREYYVIGPSETPDEDQWRTEIGWPIFATGQIGDRATGTSGSS